MVAPSKLSFPGETTDKGSATPEPMGQKPAPIPDEFKKVSLFAYPAIVSFASRFHQAVCFGELCQVDEKLADAGAWGTRIRHANPDYWMKTVEGKVDDSDFRLMLEFGTRLIIAVPKIISPSVAEVAVKDNRYHNWSDAWYEVSGVYWNGLGDSGKRGCTFVMMFARFMKALEAYHRGRTLKADNGSQPEFVLDPEVTKWAEEFLKAPNYGSGQ